MTKDLQKIKLSGLVCVHIKLIKITSMTKKMLNGTQDIEKTLRKMTATGPLFNINN